jgi:CPA1 family monovalent cation:H+ antiporter
VIAPLLYHESQTASRYWIGRGARNIISLAILLVAVTVVAVGALLHVLFPVIPLALAMTVCAIVTPTDASAVGALVPKNDEFKIPLIILQNESLFNDATGIVAFELSLAAFLTGEFSVEHAVGDFLLTFVGGLVLGVLLGFVIRGLMHLLMEFHDDTAFIMVVAELAIPFIVYFAGEELGVSGILAVVAAGLVQGAERADLGLSSSRMQLVRGNVWEIVEEVLSGIVFVLLGVSLPEVIQEIDSTYHNLVWVLVLAGVVLYAAKFVLRLVWSRYLVWMHTKSTHRWLDSLMMAFSGVSGTISLSLALMLPTQVNGQPFVYRPMLVFVATVVILISIILPVFALPRIVGSGEQEKTKADYREWTRRMIVEGIKAVRDDSEHPSEAGIVVSTLGEQLVEGKLRHPKRERRILLAANEAELAAVRALHERGEISDKDLAQYTRFLEISIFSFDNSLWKNVLLRIRFGLHTSRHSEMTEGENMLYVSPVVAEQIYWRRAFDLRGQNICVPESVGYEAVMDVLDPRKWPDSKRELHAVKQFYSERHRRLALPEPRREIIYQMFLTAFHAEYEFFQGALTEGKIPPEIAGKLQERIVYDEMAYLRNYDTITDRVTPE